MWACHRFEPNNFANKRVLKSRKTRLKTERLIYFLVIHVASSASIEPSSTLSTKSTQIPTDSTTTPSSTLMPTTTLKMSTEVATTTLQTQRSTSLRASTRAETTRLPSTASSRLVPVKHSTRTTLPKTTTRSTTVPEKSTVDDEFSWASPSKEPLEPINKIDQIPNGAFSSVVLMKFF